MKLKIGRHTYNITHEDRFLDNNVCVQLLSQNKVGGHNPASPILSKVAASKIRKMPHSVLSYGNTPLDQCRILKLKTDPGT